MSKKPVNIEVIKIPTERPPFRPKNFPKMPILYLELLENKILEENSLGYKELYNLHSSKKIDWFELSKNPKAIKLIKKYINHTDLL